MILECIHAPADDADLDDGQRTPQSPHATMDVESHFAAVHTAVSFHVEGGDGDAPVTPDKEAQKKAAFDRMRKEHYNMKAALMARVDDSDEDEDEG
mmetsp:Transcript_73869/g.173449  ORF Transcript_73869/g.173449 Transcript_73869/m.173449 type:complete len:96 (+) Transcript_73869:234-521(+)